MKQYITSVVTIPSITVGLFTCGGLKAGDKIINNVRMSDGLHYSDNRFGQYAPGDNFIAVVVAVDPGTYLISVERDM